MKPYCYRYLCNNYQIAGEPEGCISFKANRLLSSIFRNMLRHKTQLPVPQGEPTTARWRVRRVAIDIGTHNMEHHGLDLTEESKAELATLIEYICQEDFRQFFIHMYMVEPRVKSIIEQYHTLRGYSEEDWPQESMQKIVTRMRVTAQLRESRDAYLQKLNGFFTANMSAMVDYKLTKKVFSQLCNSTSTTEEESEGSMPSPSQTFCV